MAYRVSTEEAAKKWRPEWILIVKSGEDKIKLPIIGVVVEINGQKWIVEADEISRVTPNPLLGDPEGSVLLRADADKEFIDAIFAYFRGEKES